MPEGADYRASITVTTTFYAKNYLDAVQFAVRVAAEIQTGNVIEIDHETSGPFTVTGIDVEAANDGMEVE